MVLEHVKSADAFMCNLSNTLSLNGVSVHQTTSKYYLTSIMNGYVSEGLKQWLIKYLGSGNDAENIFPAYYKLNSSKAVYDLSKKYGLLCKIDYIDAPPGYVRKSFILMIAYVIIMKPLLFIFPTLRPVMILSLSKESNTTKY